jgi:Uma2 family endonuclease
MTPTLLSNFPFSSLQTIDPEERFITTGVSWQAYETILATLRDSSGYRLAYLTEVLEIMSPSRRHEIAKKNISRLLEAYLEETRTRFWGLGSTTFRQEDRKAGKEPDESYCLGTEKEIPDLAIEVIYTSGGIDTLEIYKQLGVKEVWFWQNNRFQIYYLSGDGYEQSDRSQLLPDLDLNLLSQYMAIEDPLDALIQWREQIMVERS